MKKNKIYKQLEKEYTDEEIADSFIFSTELPKSEEEVIKEEFLRLRFERLNSMSNAEKMTSELFVFKTKMMNYFKSNKYNSDFSFSTQLRRYIAITGRTNMDIANNLNIHRTKLSRLINGRDKPNIDIMYRLEEHSGNSIPAFYWWKLFSREFEHKIRTDYAKKKIEANKVENPLKIGA